MFSSRVEAALTLAARRHAGQTRKVSGVAYLTHLVHVARVVARYGFDEDHEVVALLHDILEDTCRDDAERAGVADEIDQRFGSKVAGAVRALSEPQYDDGGRRLTWSERKQAYIVSLEQAPSIALVVSAADKIHNLATLLRNLSTEGPQLWDRFRGGPDESLWFYESVHQVLARRLSDSPIVEELNAYTEALSRLVRGDSTT